MFEAFSNWIVYDLARLQDTALGSTLQSFMMDLVKILALLTPEIDGKVVHAGGTPDRNKVEGWLGGGSS